VPRPLVTATQWHKTATTLNILNRGAWECRCPTCRHPRSLSRTGRSVPISQAKQIVEWSRRIASLPTSSPGGVIILRVIRRLAALYNAPIHLNGPGASHGVTLTPPSMTGMKFRARQIPLLVILQPAWNSLVKTTISCGVPAICHELIAVWLIVDRSLTVNGKSLAGPLSWLCRIERAGPSLSGPRQASEGKGRLLGPAGQSVRIGHYNDQCDWRGFPCAYLSNPMTRTAFRGAGPWCFDGPEDYHAPSTIRPC